MELTNNPYSTMQKRFYDETFEQMRSNHSEHNNNPDYWDFLLLEMRSHPENWKGKNAMDFGCGQGRNVLHMLQAAQFNRVDGVDISKKNCEVATNNLALAGFKHPQCTFYANNGHDISDLVSSQYDLITSTIAFQHICVYDIRDSLMKEIYRLLKSDGIFSLQMGFGGSHPNTVGYKENKWDAQGTNSFCDVRIDKEEQLTNHLKEIGFNIKDVHIVSSRNLDHHSQWIFIKAAKP